jgi:hypothetical protein
MGERTGGVARWQSMVKWLPTTDRALDLILSTAGRKKKSGRTKYLNKHFSKKDI